jgi:hypothetical protein
MVIEMMLLGYSEEAKQMISKYGSCFYSNPAEGDSSELQNSDEELPRIHYEESKQLFELLSRISPEQTMKNSQIQE